MWPPYFIKMKYNHRCNSCGNVFEKSYRMGENPTIHCPNCSSDKVIRVISVTPVIYNADGFTKKSVRDES